MVQQNQSIGRRQFIKITALAGLAAGLGSALARKQAAGALHHVQETRIVMGSLANITVVADRQSDAQRAVEATFARMHELEAVLSRFQPDSQLSQLNRAGALTDAHPALRDVLGRSVQIGALTGGVFDVTVESLLALYRSAAKVNSVPAGADVTAARALVDYRQIALQGAAIRLNQPGMAVTLDGIAKGYIIDEGAAELARLGFPNVLVEVGGDMQARGQAGGAPWRIGIQSPDGRAPLATTSLQGVALATSGDYLNTFTADRRLHHILDPRTGTSPVALSSVSVSAPTACEADALSTSILALGPIEGLALVEGLANTEAFLITKHGEVLYSSGFALV